MKRKILLICLDGCEPSYIRASHTPTLDWISKTGFSVEGRCVMPSVTNVNNTSILTGAFPSEHGITSNYWFDRRTGKGDYVESAEFVRIPTVIERASALGMSTAMLTSKVKLLRLLGHGADLALAAEEPPADLVERIGAPEGIYSAQINVWLLEAGREILRTRDPDLMYLSTTDYVQHKHGPEDAISREHLAAMDRALGGIVADDPTREIYITADHGMEAKSLGLDLCRAIGAPDGAVTFMPIIKDKYVAHHDNLAGAAFLFCEDPVLRAEIPKRLSAYPEVEKVYAAVEAAAEFNMPLDRIGDYFVLGRRDVVFGQFETLRKDVRLRSHGSHHETVVPIYGLNARVPAEKFRYNIDIVRNLGI